MNEQTVKCPICGRAYKVYSMLVGDQSACPACVREAEKATTRPDTAKQVMRRHRRFE